LKRISFSAEEEMIAHARSAARAQGKSLNTLFREWLSDLAANSRNVKRAKLLMKRLSHVKAGRKFTRDEMNQR
jgi:hypothetical protein